MANFMKQTPDKDTGWGLIFRLNDLWSQVEIYSASGNYKEWNIKLDRIITNLLYRDAMEVKRDSNNNIISIDFTKADIEEKEFLDREIALSKVNLINAIKEYKLNPTKEARLKIERLKMERYEMYTKKDAWVRKLMHKKGLYIKELTSNPAGSMWNRS